MINGIQITNNQNLPQIYLITCILAITTKAAAPINTVPQAIKQNKMAATPSILPLRAP